MNLLFLNYNNYYNRIVKRESLVADYDSKATNVQEFYDIQFNPNDGVMTEQIVNWPKANDWTPDYLVVYDDMEQPAVAIKSRWFVLEWVRTRGGQYKATLYRDTIADNYNALMNAPMYVEKATIQQSDDVAIYNKENLEVNQIKQSEDLLKDETATAWLVGYFAKNIDFGSEAGQISRNITIKAPDYPTINTNTLEGWTWNQYTATDYKLAHSVDVSLYVSLEPQFFGINSGSYMSTNGTISVFNKDDGFYKALCSNVPTGGSDVRRNWIRNNLWPTYSNAAADIVNKVMEYENLHNDSSITDLDGKDLFVESGTGAGYYHIKVINKGNGQDLSYYPANSAEEGYVANKLQNVSVDYTYPTSRGNHPCVKKEIYYTSYRIELTPFTPATLTTLDWPIGAKTLDDAPYGMMCIPADSVRVYKSGQTTFRTFDEKAALNAMCTIAEHLGAFCYDIQKLPYCPILGIKTLTEQFINIDSLTEGTDYAYIMGGSNTKQGIIFYCDTSTFSFNISRSLTIPRNVLDDHEDTYVEDMKIANQCDFYRMYSPNWAASFEFNLVKTGDINTFNVDCTYKPFTPYIHINPLWGRLYGQDFDDYRGLICQGDFSIPRVNDAWTQYQINNKNYLNSFNRQVDSLELSQSVERKQQAFNAITGTITGAAAGAATGAKLGGGYGAIAGAVVGGATSAIGGALDYHYGEMLRNEALDLRVDQFNYSLQNIQALPDTLAKVSTYDANNKIFPVLEYYTCTYQEKVALLNKMIYNGMTIMRIGTLAEFMDSDKHYIKGKLIRCEEIADDYHILTAIAEELNKGVYI